MRAIRARRQRGVALLAALLAVALAVVLVAALLDRGEEVRMRTAHALRAEQSWQLLRGMEGWAIGVLRNEDAIVDSRSDLWAQPLPPVEVPGGRVAGSLRELGGCFNLNSLVRSADEEMQRRFERLLRALRLDPGIAAAARDWIDADGDPGTGGAEDAQYRVASPAYRAANRAFVHISEMRLLRGVDADAYAALLPHVCVLPDAEQPMNLNTASVELWMSLREDISEGMARRMWLGGEARYGDVRQVEEVLEKELGLPPDSLQTPPLVGVTTRFFVMRAEIEADGLPFLYSSLIDRAPEGGAQQVLARVRGNW